jgi:hypothetical protein
LTTPTTNLFWDSCVFIRFLTQSSGKGLNHIHPIISDAKKNIVKIYYSTIIYTEIRPSHLKSEYGSIDNLFKALGSSFEPIDPNPNILKFAGELRDARPTNPNKGETTSRVIGTPDAIQLMTCVHVRDTLDVSDIEFQTYDEGKNPGWEGKCVPLLGFERWYPENSRGPRVQEVCDLPRVQPHHENPGLEF